MNSIITKLFKGFQKGTNITEAVNEFLQQELTSFSEYEKWNPNGYNSGDRRNGSYTRSFNAKLGKTMVITPRDCIGESKHLTVTRYQRND